MIPAALREEAEACLWAWGCELDPGAWRLAEDYLRAVLEHGAKANLTAADTAEELLRRHLLDAWAAIAPLRARLGPEPELADIGAGAGFIGIGIKLGWPRARVTLVESVYKKFMFLSAAAARLGLPGVSVVQARVDPAGTRAAGLKPGYDAVLSRAVAGLPEAAALGLSLTRAGGWAAAYRSDAPDPAKPELARALAGAALETPFAYRLPRENRFRHLVFFRKAP